MKKKIIWPILSCLMVIPLMLGACAPALTEEEKALQAEVEAFVSRLFEAAVAKDIDYLSDKWWEYSDEAAENLINAGWERFQGFETICVKVYPGVAGRPWMIEGGKTEIRPEPGLQGDTATYVGKLIGAQESDLPYRGFYLWKLGGEWKIFGGSAGTASGGCP